MGILAHLFSRQAETPKPWDDFWYNAAEGPTASGISIGPDTALQISAVYAAVRILAETLANVPLVVYRRVGEGKERALNHPLYSLLHSKPNQIQTSMEWREMQMGHLLLRGNAYSEIVPGERGFVNELRPLHPARMTPIGLANGRVGYRYRRETGEMRSYTQDEIFHLRGLSSDGIQGLCPVTIMRQSLGLTSALELFGAYLFSNGALHRGVYKHPGQLSKPAYDRLRASLKEEHSGVSKSHGTLLLEEGMSWEQTGMDAEDAQFLVSRKFQINEIARWFNVPPHLLKDLEKATFSNIEQQSLEFVMFSMIPWFVRWEQRMLSDLVLAPQTYFAEFLVDGLLRGDIKSRYEGYKSAIESGWMNRNEPRIKENMNPAPGLDQFLVPQNMATVDAAGRVMPVNNQNSTAAEHYYRVFAQSAERVIRKEALAVAKGLARHGDDQDKFADWAEGFYADYAKFVADVMCLDPEHAGRFAQRQKDKLILSVNDNCAAALIKEMEIRGAGIMLDFLKGENDGEVSTRLQSSDEETMGNLAGEIERDNGAHPA